LEFQRGDLKGRSGLCGRRRPTRGQVRSAALGADAQMAEAALGIGEGAVEQPSNSSSVKGRSS